MAKMCKWYKSFTSLLNMEITDGCDAPYTMMDTDGNVDCPKNTNERCEIIPRRKSEYVRVRAWARMDEESGCDIIYATNVLPKHFSGAYNTPCTITFLRKHLKGGK